MNFPCYEMMLSLGDIRKIGNTTCEGEYGTDFICNGVTSNIEEIMLRSILNQLGYKIIKSSDFEWENGTIDINIQTNLPYVKYMEMSQSSWDEEQGIFTHLEPDEDESGEGDETDNESVDSAVL